ncbi:phage terminase small subunit [Clostridium novyi]|uniref:phage terminase small subunit n=1 Tax=Clostridium novyi TaxID=1542 RepID=UPI0004D8B96E|nr:phage terminase small subunit [Clostridium novyi]KEH88872.1 phage-related terminase small subunit-like protein [Clostridium novyi A str. GD211209]
MARARNPNRDKAFNIFKQNLGEITSKEIAKILNEKLSNINLWRSTDHWQEKLRSKVGAPFNNKNAVGNKGGRGAKENQNSRKHGFYSKYLPKEVFDAFEDIEDMSPLEILWTNIKIKYAAILRSQKIMFVKDIDDKTIEIKKQKSQFDYVGEKGSKHLEEVYSEKELEIQQAWDKQANFLQAQSKAMSTLTNMIKRYEEMLHANWENATEEQKLRIERLKQRIENKEFEHRKEVDNKKLELERKRFEHNKKMDELKVW